MVFAASTSSLLLSGCATPKPERPLVADVDVRGCTPDALGSLENLDVAIVIDTSHSTLEPSGADIDGDGLTGTFERSRYTDREDSRLASEIAAVRRLIDDTAGRDVRFAIVTYDGPSVSRISRRTEYLVGPNEGRIRVDLTTDTSVLNAVLDEIAQVGPGGATMFYAGMHHANKVLMRYPTERRRRIVLFISDGPSPFQRHEIGNESGVDRRYRRRADAANVGLDHRMKAAARKAISESIVFHTFGLSSEASSWRDEPLGRIAGATGGNYHAVEDPTQFHCHLERSLLPSTQASLEGPSRTAGSRAKP